MIFVASGNICDITHAALMSHTTLTVKYKNSFNKSLLTKQDFLLTIFRQTIILIYVCHGDTLVHLLLLEHALSYFTLL